MVIDLFNSMLFPNDKITFLYTECDKFGEGIFWITKAYFVIKQKQGY